MGRLVALALRELKSFWCSPIAYVVGALFLLLQGLTFWLLITVLNDPRVDPALTMSQIFFGGTFYYWVALLFVAPVLSMRTFSEEKRSGTIELLLTAPVTDTQVVIAKFLGTWIAYIVLWGMTFIFFLLLRRFTPFAWGPVFTGYLGTWLLGAALISIGILASSLTRNQIIAAVVSFGVLLILFSIGVLDVFVHNPSTLAIIHYLSLTEHLRAFSKGILDTRPLIFYLSVTIFFLFLTVRVIGSPRWRS